MTIPRRMTAVAEGVKNNGIEAISFLCLCLCSAVNVLKAILITRDLQVPVIRESFDGSDLIISFMAVAIGLENLTIFYIFITIRILCL